MLINTLKIIVNNPFKKSFYKKRKKKVINVLTVFSIFYENGIKIFLKWIINHYPKVSVSMTHILYFIFYID